MRRLTQLASRHGADKRIRKMAVDALIVDDSDTTRGMLRRRLEAIGCNVIGEASNASEALQIFRMRTPHLVTLDVMMPTVGGLDAKSLLARIRAEAPQVVVFVVSSFSRENQGRDFLDAGAADYLQKPFINFEELSKKLQNYFPELRGKP